MGQQDLAASYQNQTYEIEREPLLSPPSSSKPASGMREIYAKEYREGDSQVRFALSIPSDVNPPQTLTVSLGGREFHVDVPDYVARNETVVVIAPAAVSGNHAHGEA